MFRSFLPYASRRILHTMNDQGKAKHFLRCGTFNVLAPCYNWISGWWGRCESAESSLYLPRFQAIIDYISNQSPSLDILCLQEFWFQDNVMELFESQFEKQYRIVKLKRTGLKTDGLAIMIDRSISVLAINPVQLSYVNQRVALLVHLLLPDNEEVILMTTHLTYCSNFIHKYLRMSQINTIISWIENYQIKNNMSHVPVLLAGDFNGSQEDAVYNHIVKSGFLSSYKTVHKREPRVTHRLYNGEQVPVDYIFYRNSCLSHLVPKQSMVLPTECSDEEWPKEYNLSDHRMVVTEFELKKQNA